MIMFRRPFFIKPDSSYQYAVTKRINKMYKCKTYAKSDQVCVTAEELHLGFQKLIKIRGKVADAYFLHENKAKSQLCDLR